MQAAIIDIEAVYHIVSVWPLYKRGLIVDFNGQVWIDHMFQFSLTTAGDIQGDVANTTVDILHHLNIFLIKKWVDNHFIFRFSISGSNFKPWWQLDLIHIYF